MAELDLREARGEAERALIEVQAERDPESTPYRSREAAILDLVAFLMPLSSKDRQMAESRKRRLASSGHSVSDLASRASVVIAKSPTSLHEATTPYGFIEVSPVDMAYLARRYAEDTADPLRMPGKSSAGSLMNKAIPWIAAVQPDAAFVLGIRNGETFRDAPIVPGRHLPQVGSKLVRDIFTGLIVTLQHASEELPALAGQKQYASSLDDEHAPGAGPHGRTRTALHQLEKLSPVLDADEIADATTVVLRLRRSWKGGQWQTWNAIEDACQFLLAKCSRSAIDELLPDILTQPVVGAKNDLENVTRLDDALARASIRTEDTHNETPSDDVTKAIDDLLDLLQGEQDTAVRGRIAMRIAVAWHHGRLGPERHDRFADILRGMHISGEDLHLDHADLLLLPQIADAPFRLNVPTSLANAPWQNFVERDDVGNRKTLRMQSTRNDPIVIAAGLTQEPWTDADWLLRSGDWSKEAIATMMDRMAAWLEEEGLELLAEERDPLFGSLTQRHEAFVKFCTKVMLPQARELDDEIERAASLINEMMNHGLWIDVAASVFSVVSQDGADKSAAILRDAASSLIADRSFGYLTGILTWLAIADREQVSPPPDDLVSEVAVSVRSRRAPELLWSLQVATIIVEYYYQQLPDGFVRDIEVGLRFLVGETNIDAPSDNLERQVGEVGRLRLEAVRLTSSLSDKTSNPDIVEMWRESAENETVREVRKAFKRLFARTSLPS